MTRICRYENLTFPEPEAFGHELDFVRGTLSDLHDENVISGAFIYGSATSKGDANPCSDIDLLVTSPTPTTDLGVNLREMTTTVHERSGIPVDVTYFTEAQLVTGAHGFYRRNLAYWLRLQAKQRPENVIGRDPTEHIKPLEEDLLTSIDVELGQLSHYFEMSYMKGSGVDNEELLEKILNYPHKAGRECISALFMEGIIPPEVVKDARKKDVGAMIEQVFGTIDPTLMELYKDISSDLNRYTEFASSVRTLGISKDEYEQALAATTADNLSKAVELSKRMQIAFRNLVPNRTWPPMRSVI